jgi:hypothetical protein
MATGVDSSVLGERTREASVPERLSGTYRDKT